MGQGQRATFYLKFSSGKLKKVIVREELIDIAKKHFQERNIQVIKIQYNLF